MKCWTCNDIDLIWGGDEDHENEDGNLEIVTNLHCPRCGAEVFVHHGGQKRTARLGRSYGNTRAKPTLGVDLSNIIV